MEWGPKENLTFFNINATRNMPNSGRLNVQLVGELVIFDRGIFDRGYSPGNEDTRTLAEQKLWVKPMILDAHGLGSKVCGARFD